MRVENPKFVRPVVRSDASTKAAQDQSLMHTQRQLAKRAPSFDQETSGLAKPPIDEERIVAVKRALETGTYPLVPSKIADAIIAARYVAIQMEE